MIKIFIASANLGKIREVKAILADTSLDLLDIFDQTRFKKLGIKLNPDFDVAETGQTFQENALLKARAYAQLTGMLTIADDSGLEVAALDGFPSIYSNRWFTGSAAERNLALLALLKDQQNRQAKFCTVMCLYNPNTSQAKFFRGEVKGKIALHPSAGKNEGFGYDPIFIPEGYDRSFAELGIKVKNAISHRRLALLKLSQYVLQDKHLALLE